MRLNDTTSTARIGNTSYLDRPGGRIGKPKSPGLTAVEIRDLSKHFGPATTVRAQVPVRLTGALERRGHRVDRDGDVLNVLALTGVQS